MQAFAWLSRNLEALEPSDTNLLSHARDENGSSFQPITDNRVRVHLRQTKLCPDP